MNKNSIVLDCCVIKQSAALFQDAHALPPPPRRLCVPFNVGHKQTRTEKVGQWNHVAKPSACFGESDDEPRIHFHEPRLNEK